MNLRRKAGADRGRAAFLPVGLVLISGLIGVATAVSGSPTSAQDSSGADLYAAHCAGCHQAAGEGISGTFPPLASNPAAADADYVAAVITDGKSGAIEVLGVGYDTAMPAVGGLSDADVEAIVGHVVELAGDQTEPAEPSEPAEAPTEGDIDQGEDKFRGRDRLHNGGGSCASCHTAGKVGNLGGNSLGPELTDVYERFGGQAGLAAWLTNPPSETMAPIFADRPLTDQEINDLVAFLADAPSQDRPNDDADWLLTAGIVGLVVLIGGMAIAWRGPRRTYAETLRSKR